MSKKGYYLNIERIKLRAERERVSKEMNEVRETVKRLEDDICRFNRIFWSGFLILVILLSIWGPS